MNPHITRATLGSLLLILPLAASPAAALLRLAPNSEIQVKDRESQEPRKESEWPAWSQPTNTIEQAAVSGRIKRGAYEAFRREKEVPVIVMLKTSRRFRPEGDLSAAQVEKQREEVGRLQETVLRQINQKFQGKEVQFIKRYLTIPYLALHLDRQVLPALVRMPEITRIYFDGNPTLALDTSIPVIGANKVHSAFGTSPTDARAAGAGQSIAVIDTGVDSGHPFLSGRVVEEACFSSGDSLCRSGNDAEIGTGAGAACALPTCNHGTLVAGIIAGNGSTMTGVAPQANIIAIKAAHAKPCGDSSCVTFDDCDLIRALEHVFSLRRNHRIAAVNLSLANKVFYTSQADCDDDYAYYRDVIANLRSVGIVAIAAAGNSAAEFNKVGLSGPFACLSNVVSVGATRDDDTLPNFSQTASFLQLLAPGHEVRSSTLGGAFSPTAPVALAAGEVLPSGTSFAAPHVAGAWAVLRGTAFWGTPAIILSVLRSTGVQVRDTRFGAPIVVPRLQLDKAVESHTGAPLPPSNPRMLDADGTSITVGWADNSNSESEFKILATPESANRTLAPQSIWVGPNSTGGRVARLACSTIYEIRVRACNAAGRCSDSNPITAETRNTLPASPTNFRASNITTNSIETSWEWAGSGVPVAEFRLRSDANFRRESRRDHIPPGTRSRLFSNLNLASGGYSFRIQACNADGCCTPDSSLHVVTESLGPPPSAPTNLRICTRTVAVPSEICFANVVGFYWNDTSDNEDRFEFEWTFAQPGRNPGAGNWSSDEVPTNRTQYFRPPLFPGLHYFRVRACNAAGCSSYSNQIMHTAP